MGEGEMERMGEGERETFAKASAGKSGSRQQNKMRGN
jgi:hypothetical protein